MFGASHPAQMLARAVGKTARATLRQGARLLLAVLIGTIGLSYLIFAGFAVLRLLLGPELAALLTGVILLGLAAGLARSAGVAVRPTLTETPAAVPPVPPSVAPQSGHDPATLAVFTLAYVLGRRFADRRRD